MAAIWKGQAMIDKPKPDWLERWGIIPELHNSRRNSFLREHLPAEDMRSLERASIGEMYVLFPGLFMLGSALGPSSWIPNWLMLLLGVGACFIGVRSKFRVERAWKKALGCD